MDLISRKAVHDGMMKYGFIAPDMTVHEFVEDELPSTPAVPLDKLCELIAEANYVVPCRICEYCGTRDCEIFPCPSTAEGWRNALTKWMEGIG